MPRRITSELSVERNNVARKAFKEDLNLNAQELKKTLVGDPRFSEYGKIADGMLAQLRREAKAELRQEKREKKLKLLAQRKRRGEAKKTNGHDMKNGTVPMGFSSSLLHSCKQIKDILIDEEIDLLTIHRDGRIEKTTKQVDVHELR